VTPPPGAGVGGKDAGDERFHAETREQWRAWLAEHHADSPRVWVVTWKRATGRPAPSYEDLVEEALCYGWVDSTAGTVDDERSMLRFSPRKPGSGWARTNKARIERLTAEGLMAEAGLAVVRRAHDDGSWSLLDDVENLVVPADLAAALDALPPARANFDAFPPSARRAILLWLVQAKRAETREGRVRKTAELARRNERAVP
jgi:uncharacterized protein YdeI (YjbR/CyaY-like superfamily)